MSDYYNIKAKDLLDSLIRVPFSSEITSEGTKTAIMIEIIEDALREAANPISPAEIAFNKWHPECSSINGREPTVREAFISGWNIRDRK